MHISESEQKPIMICQHVFVARFSSFKTCVPFGLDLAAELTII